MRNYHVKIPYATIVNMWPDWDELTPNVKDFRMRVYGNEIKERLKADSVIVTQYSEVSALYYGIERCKIFRQLWRLRELFKSPTPYGMHIIRIK